MVNTVKVHANGPYEVSGELKIAGAAVASPVWLCRCGHSKKKPYCDSSHKTVGFADPGTLVPPAKPGAVAAGDGLTIQPLPNGPLMCQGALDVHDATGSGNVSIGRATLCRCGGSKTKPFCDGTHKVLGFIA